MHCWSILCFLNMSDTSNDAEVLCQWCINKIQNQWLTAASVHYCDIHLFVWYMKTTTWWKITSEWFFFLLWSFIIIMVINKVFYQISPPDMAKCYGLKFSATLEISCTIFSCHIVGVITVISVQKICITILFIIINIVIVHLSLFHRLPQCGSQLFSKKSSSIW